MTKQPKSIKDLGLSDAELNKFGATKEQIKKILSRKTGKYEELEW